MKKLPGTTFEIGQMNENAAENVFRTLFAGGGLMMSQVSSLTGLEPYMIQNWVKRGFLSPPQRKLYSKNQFCRIAIINMLKDSLQMDKICELLSYINGRLDDEADDRIEDSGIYNIYCNLIVALKGKQLTDEVLEEETEKLIKNVTEDETTRRRLKIVLTVMSLAHRAASLKTQAELKLCELD